MERGRTSKWKELQQSNQVQSDNTVAISALECLFPSVGSSPVLIIRMDWNNQKFNLYLSHDPIAGHLSILGNRIASWVRSESWLRHSVSLCTRTLSNWDWLSTNWTPAISNAAALSLKQITSGHKCAISNMLSWLRWCEIVFRLVVTPKFKKGIMMEKGGGFRHSSMYGPKECPLREELWVWSTKSSISLLQLWVICIVSSKCPFCSFCFGLSQNFFEEGGSIFPWLPHRPFSVRLCTFHRHRAGGLNLCLGRFLGTTLTTSSL